MTLQDQGEHHELAYIRATTRKKADQETQSIPCWYEAAITSNAVEEAFEENMNLEIAQEARWTPSSLLTEDANKGLRDLLNPACDMIKSMDGIGYYNDNELTTGYFANPPGSVADLVIRAHQNSSFW